MALSGINDSIINTHINNYSPCNLSIGIKLSGKGVKDTSNANNIYDYNGIGFQLWSNTSNNREIAIIDTSNATNSNYSTLRLGITSNSATIKSITSNSVYKPLVINDYLTVTSNRVGIGTTNPISNLDIRGNFNLTGSLNINNSAITTIDNSPPTATITSNVISSNSAYYYVTTQNNSITFPSLTTVSLLIVGAGGNGGLGAYSGGGGAGEVIYLPSYIFNPGTYNLSIGISTNNPTNRISKITYNSTNTDLIKANGGGDGGYFNILISGNGNTINIDNNLQQYRYISFINSGTFILNTSIVCDVLIVGGGGAGGSSGGGGGGAGGLIYLSNQTISSGTYNVVVGAGGTASTAADNTMKGGDSSFNGVIAYGGGGGEHMGTAGSATALSYTNGGSGGGGERLSVTDSTIAGRDGGSGVSGQGNNGGQGKNYSGYNAAGGGGGGAGAVGQSAFTAGRGGNGGIGSQISITGTNTYYAGGGGGGSGSDFTVAGTGGSGGGGNGAISDNVGTNGTNGLGGGGGGGSAANGTGTNGGTGGSGVVIIRLNASYGIVQPTNGGSGGGSYLDNSGAYILTPNSSSSLITIGKSGSLSQGGEGGSALSSGIYTSTIINTNLIVGTGGSGATITSTPSSKTTFGSGGDGNGGVGYQGIIIIKYTVGNIKTLFLKNDNVNVNNLYANSNIIISGSIFKSDGTPFVTANNSVSSQWTNSINNQNNIYFNSGFIGIGTNNPQSLFHLAASNTSNISLRLTDAITGHLNNNGLILQKNSNQQGLLWNYQNSDLIFGTNDNERLRIKNDGKIGIGTTSPVYLLDINGNTNTQELLIKGSNISNIIDNKILITSNILVNYSNLINKPDLSIYATITNLNTKQSNITFNNPFLNTNNTIDLKIDSSLTIDGSGNLKVVGTSSQWTTNSTVIYYNSGDIGIGTNTPQSILHLHKSGVAQAIRLQFTDGTTGNTSTNGFLIYKGTDHHGYIYNQENKDIVFGTNKIERMRIKNDGSITINSNVDIIGGLALSGSSAFVNNTSVDSGNITNTYINFKEAGSTNDWCYLRQIGTADNYKLALDFHDDGTDANFVIRNVNSSLATDSITEVFSVANTYTYINGLRIGGADTNNIIYQATGNIGISVVQSTANIVFNINSTELFRITPDTINSTKRLYFTSTLVAGPSVGITGGTSGDRIILYQGSASVYPYAFGINSSILWYSIPASCSHIFYIGGTETFNINTTSIKTQKDIELAHTTNPAVLFSGYGESAIAVASTAGSYSTSSAIGDLVIRSQANKKIVLQNSSGIGVLFVNGGNIGIGTTNPTTPLHVMGNIKLTGDILNSSGNSILSGITSSQWTTNSTSIYYNNSVAIGKATNNTAYKLEVINNAIIGTEVTDRNSFDHSLAPLTLTNQTPTSSTVLNDPKPVLHLCRQGTSGLAYGARATFNICRYENSTTDSRTRLDISLAHTMYDNVTVMSLRSDGNVGIGTTNPTSRLHIEHNSAATNVYGVCVNNPYNTANSTSTIITRIAGSSANKAMYSLDVSGLYGWSMYINGNDTTNKTLRFNNTNNASSATDYFVIRGDNGNVGLGTGTPLYKLHVEQGSVFIGDSACIGSTTSSTVNNYKLIFNNSYDGTDGTGTPCNKIVLFNNNSSMCGLGVQDSGLAYHTKTSHKFYTETTPSSYGTLGLTLSANNFNFVGNASSSSTLTLQNTNNGSSATSVFRLINDTSANYFEISLSSTTATTASAVVLKNYASGYFTIYNSINNGIQLTPTDTKIYNSTNTDISFYTNAIERMRIKNDGKIGIGIANPLSLFHVAGDIRLSGSLLKTDGSSYVSAVTSPTISINSNIFYYSNSQLNISNFDIASGTLTLSTTNTTMNNTTITNNLIVGQKIGIKNTSPIFSLDIGNDSITNTFSATIGILNTSGGSTTTSLNATDIVVKASGSVWSTSTFIASSDERIKTNINDINDDSALQKILKIEPKTYNYIDFINKGTCNVYGFIAQQIREHIPEAVVINSEYIPNVYKIGNINNLNEITIDNNCNLSSNIKINDNIRIITENSGTNNYIITDIKSSNCFTINENLYNSNCIIYGTQVQDFHTLDKTYIYTLNVCATQELYKIIAQQQNQINELLLSIEELQKLVI